MKILVIEDAVFKREEITDLLNAKGIAFEIAEYLNPALKYIVGNKDEISGIILDLGFQMTKDLPESYSLYRGLDVLRELNRKHIHIPVLINSSTEVKRLEIYPFVYGQRTRIDDPQLLEDFVSFLRERDKQ